VSGTGYWHWTEGNPDHWVELYPPSLEFAATGDKYDFQFHPMPNWTVYSSFWTGTGFLYVNGERAYGTIGAGAPLCKYGRETGYACGTVRNPDFFFNYEQSRGYILWRKR